LSNDLGIPVSDTTGPRHAAPGPTAETALTCPECRADLQVASSATSIDCRACLKTIRCTQCKLCAHIFPVVKSRSRQCPNCLHVVRRSKGKELPFSALGNQRTSGVVPPAPPTVTEVAPSLDPFSHHRTINRHVLIAVAVVVVLGGLALIALSLHHDPGHHTGALVDPSTTAAANNAAGCPAASLISYRTSQRANGTYAVTAVGTVGDSSSSPLADVEVTWRVSYADLSEGAPTTTAVNAPAPITKSQPADWSGNASTNDGSVPPTGVHVVSITYDNGAVTC
jgi:hypothetical protein